MPFHTPLILLHGATGSARQLAPLAERLSGSHDVHALNFHEHGGEPITDEGFSIERFAKQVAAYINKLSPAQPVNIFGYSMGGYVAMYVARHLELNIANIITLGTKFHWDEATAAKECKMLQPRVIEEKVPAFAQQLAERHHPQSWKEVLNKTAEMLQQMGTSNPLQIQDLTHIHTRSLIMLGDRDKMVTREETIAVYQQLSNAQLAILPGTSHPIEQADIALLAYHIHRFLSAM